MPRNHLIALALTVAACSSDRYNDDKKGQYGNGPTLSSCAGPNTCQKNAASAANEIRHEDPDFERKYLDSMPLEDALSEILTHGFLRQRRVRILKAYATGEVMRAYISVQDDEGQPTTDLAALGFAIGDGTRDLPFTTGGVVPQTALRLSTVMDYSGSMGAAISQLEQANVQFYHSLSNAQFALVKFSSTAEIIAPMDQYEASRSLDPLFTQDFAIGNTALFDGIVKGLETHQSAAFASEASADTLSLGVVFTDGVENASLTSYDAVKTRLRNAKIPQIILGMGNVDIKSLLTLAEDTNGLFQFVANGDGIEAGMARVTSVANSILTIDIPLTQELSGLKPEQLVAKLKEKE